MASRKETIKKYRQYLAHVWNLRRSGATFDEVAGEEVRKKFNIAAAKRDLLLPYSESDTEPTEADAVDYLNSLYRRQQEQSKMRLERNANPLKPKREQQPTLFSVCDNDEDIKGILMRSIPDDILAQECLNRGKEFIINLCKTIWNS